MLTVGQTKRNIGVLQFLEMMNFGYLFAIPVMLLYIPLHTGGGNESYFQIATWMNAASILFALFIGAYSDFYSRRTLLILSMILKTICWVLFAFFPSYETFLVGLVCYVIGGVACNTSACLYETVTASIESLNYRKLEQKIQAYPQYACAVLLPISGYLYTVNPVYPFMLNVCAGVIGIVLAVLYTEAPRKKSDHTSPFTLMADALKYMKRTPDIRYLSLYASFVRPFVMCAIFVIQARFFELGGSVMAFSILVPIIYFVRGVGAQSVSTLFEKTKHNDVKALAAILIVSSCFYFLAGALDFLWLSAFASVMYMLFRGMQMPALNFVCNDAFESDKRATLSSAIFLMMRLQMIGLMALIALLIENYGVGVTLMVLGAGLAVIGGLLLMAYAQSKGGAAGTPDIESPVKTV
jgi:MFS family permease